ALLASSIRGPLALSVQASPVGQVVLPPVEVLWIERYCSDRGQEIQRPFATVLYHPGLAHLREAARLCSKVLRIISAALLPPDRSQCPASLSVYQEFPPVFPPGWLYPQADSRFYQRIFARQLFDHPALYPWKAVPSRPISVVESKRLFLFRPASF